MGNKLGAPPGGGGGGGGTGNGTPEGAGTTAAEGAGKPGDTSHSTHSRLLRPGGPAGGGSGAVVNGVMSEPTVAGGGGSCSGDPEAEGLADVPPPMMPIKASIPLSATATSVAAAVDENVSQYSIAES